MMIAPKVATAAARPVASPASMSHYILAVKPCLNCWWHIVTGCVSNVPWFFWYDFPTESEVKCVGKHPFEART